MSLRQEAEKKFGVQASIKTGTPGDMRVWVDGKSVFHYKQEGGVMPEMSELIRRIEGLQTQGAT